MYVETQGRERHNRPMPGLICKEVLNLVPRRRKTEERMMAGKGIGLACIKWILAYATINR
jgi:hypothetical protein